MCRPAQDRDQWSSRMQRLSGDINFAEACCKILKSFIRPLALQEMEMARDEVSRILQQPQTDLEQLRDTVDAQTEHAGNMCAAKDAAVQSLAQCRQDKDRLLMLMSGNPPPTVEALAAAGIRLPGD